MYVSEKGSEVKSKTDRYGIFALISNANTHSSQPIIKRNMVLDKIRQGVVHGISKRDVVKLEDTFSVHGNKIWEQTRPHLLGEN